MTGGACPVCGRRGLPVMCSACAERAAEGRAMWRMMAAAVVLALGVGWAVWIALGGGR